MSGKVFNVGVIGYGLSAKVFHIPFIKRASSFRLHSIVQRTPKQDDSAPLDHPDLKHYNDAQELIAEPEIDVVVITSTPNTHYEFTKASLEANKHVLVEKPFVPTSQEADKLAAIATEKKRMICVYQNRRWDLDFITVKSILRKGTLGRIFEFNTHFDFYTLSGSTKWKSQLGVAQAGTSLYDLGTHLIDQAYSVFGLPQSVHGRLINQREGSLDLVMPDAIAIELTYPEGLLVNVRASALSVETTQPRFWIRGTKGSFHKWGLDPQEGQLVAGGQVTDAWFGHDSPDSYKLTITTDKGGFRDGELPELEPETYLAFYEAWGQALASGDAAKVPVKAYEARDVLRIIEAAFESAKQGKDIALKP